SVGSGRLVAAVFSISIPPMVASWQITACPSAESRASNSNPSQPCCKQSSNDARVFSGTSRKARAPRCPRRRGLVIQGFALLGVLGVSAVKKRRNQSKSKSRIGFPVSGVSLAFFTASWNFFSSSSEACFCASIDWRKIESRRLSCSFMARAASSISLKVFGLTGAVCAMMLRVAASIFITAPQQGQVTSKLDSRELDSRFTTRDHTAIGRNWPQSASARREANRQNIEQIQHFPTQQNDRHHHHQNRQNLAKAQTPVMFETARPQAQNIQRGEAKHQRPENVVNLPAGRSQKEHSGQNPDRQRAQSTARELYPPVGLPRYNKQR